MIKKPTFTDLMMTLTPQEAMFVVQYVKDFSARRAATSVGMQPDQGYKLLNEPHIAKMVENICIDALEACNIDAEWLLMEMVDNHSIARFSNNITASNTALGQIAKHTMVDANASDKLNMNIHTDKDVADRLTRGRVRAAEAAKTTVSFM